MFDHLSYTMYEMFLRCGERVRRRYVLGHRIPPGFAQLRGTGQHSAQRLDLERKLQTGALAPLEEVQDAARDSIASVWDHGSVLLTEEERLIGPARVRDRLVDETLRLATLHHKEAAPLITPQHVEAKLTIRASNLPVPIIGYADVVERDLSVIDTKTTGKSPAAGEADRSDQLVLYSLAVSAHARELSPQQRLDFLVATSSGRTTFVRQETRNTKADHARVLAKMERVWAAMRSGAFPPALPSAWWCSPKWCGYYQTCPYVRRGAVVTVPATATSKIEEASHGETESEPNA